MFPLLKKCIPLCLPCIYSKLHSSYCTNFYNEENQRWLNALSFASSFYIWYTNLGYYAHEYLWTFERKLAIFYSFDNFKLYSDTKITSVRFGLYFLERNWIHLQHSKIGRLKRIMNFWFLLQNCKFSQC